jgi:hypothetical protein
MIHYGSSKDGGHLEDMEERKAKTSQSKNRDYVSSWLNSDVGCLRTVWGREGGAEHK